MVRILTSRSEDVRDRGLLFIRPQGPTPISGGPKPRIFEVLVGVREFADDVRRFSIGREVVPALVCFWVGFQPVQPLDFFERRLAEARPMPEYVKTSQNSPAIQTQLAWGKSHLGQQPCKIRLNGKSKTTFEECWKEGHRSIIRLIRPVKRARYLKGDVNRNFITLPEQGQVILGNRGRTVHVQRRVVEFTRLRVLSRDSLMIGIFFYFRGCRGVSRSSMLGAPEFEGSSSAG